MSPHGLGLGFQSLSPHQSSSWVDQSDMRLIRWLAKWGHYASRDPFEESQVGPPLRSSCPGWRRHHALHDRAGDDHENGSHAIHLTGFKGNKLNRIWHCLGNHPFLWSSRLCCSFNYTLHEYLCLTFVSRRGLTFFSGSELALLYFNLFFSV